MAKATNKPESVSEFSQALMGDGGPLERWSGTKTEGAVRWFVSGICISAERVELGVDELVTVLDRRLGELAEAATIARSTIQECVAKWEQATPNDD